MKKHRRVTLAKRVAGHAARERLSDDEIAKHIISELHLSAALTKAEAINIVKSKITELRDSDRKAAEEPRPSETQKTIDRVVSHARALVFNIERLSPQWRSIFRSRVFSARVDYIPVLEAASFIEAAQTKMNRWISDLKRIPEFGRMQLRPSDIFTRRKQLCAFAARDLIMALSPATKLKKGNSSKFNKVTSWLWQALTGKQEINMRRICNPCIDLFRVDEQREQQWRDEAEAVSKRVRKMLAQRSEETQIGKLVELSPCPARELIGRVHFSLNLKILAPEDLSDRCFSRLSSDAGQQLSYVAMAWSSVAGGR